MRIFTLRSILPLVIFIAIIFLLYRGLSINTENAAGNNVLDILEDKVLDSEMGDKVADKVSNAISKKIALLDSDNNIASETLKRRNFQLKSLNEPDKTLTQELFLGKITILNVFASWCGPCRLEQDFLVKIAKETSALSWVGLNINDHSDEAKRMLQIYGNPYQEIIYDPEGRLAINYGIRGTPALLILDKNAKVRYRHYGPINTAIWEQEILPIIKELQN